MSLGTTARMTSTRTLRQYIFTLPIFAFSEPLDELIDRSNLDQCNYNVVFLLMSVSEEIIMSPPIAYLRWCRLLAVDVYHFDSIGRVLGHPSDLPQVGWRCCSRLLLQALEIGAELGTVNSHFARRRELDRTRRDCHGAEATGGRIVCRRRAIEP